MFNQIINPIDNKSYSIYSNQGKQILKNYVKLYSTNIGGSDNQIVIDSGQNPSIVNMIKKSKLQQFPLRNIPIGTQRYITTFLDIRDLQSYLLTHKNAANNINWIEQVKKTFGDIDPKTLQEIFPDKSLHDLEEEAKKAQDDFYQALSESREHPGPEAQKKIETTSKILMTKNKELAHMRQIIHPTTCTEITDTNQRKACIAFYNLENMVIQKILEYVPEENATRNKLSNYDGDDYSWPYEVKFFRYLSILEHFNLREKGSAMKWWNGAIGSHGDDRRIFGDFYKSVNSAKDVIPFLQKKGML